MICVTRKLAAATLTVLAVLCGLALCQSTAQAVDRTWSGAPVGNGDWTTSSRWGGTAPVAGDVAVFDGTGTYGGNISEFGAIPNLLRMEFTGAALPAVTTGGQSWTMSAAGTVISVDASVTSNIDINMNRTGGPYFYQLAGNSAITNNGSGSLTVRSSQTAGKFRGSTSAASELVVGGSGDMTMGGSATSFLTDGTGGALSLTKNGGGTLTFDTNNAYTGATTINGGIIEYTANQSNATTYSGTGTIRLDAPLTNLNGNAIFSAAFTGLIDVATGGDVSYFSNATEMSANLSDLNMGASSNFRINSSNVQIDALTGSGDIRNTAGSPNAATLTIGANGGSGIFSGAIQSTSGTAGAGIINVNKTGAGTQTLSGANTYRGTTTVSQGTLLINGTHTATTGSTGAYTVASSATLGGDGSTAGAASTSSSTSVISPGDTLGTLTLGSLDASLGATFDFELGTTSDLLDITGALTGSTSAGGLLFDLSDSGGIADLTPYTLFTFGSSSGLDNSDLVANSLPAGLMLDANFGTGGWLINAGNLQVQFAVVPEPSTFALSGFGLMALGFVGGRRRRNRK